MPANLHNRIDEAGAYYHVYNKGIDKRVIFEDIQDYEVFQSFLKDYLTAPLGSEATKKVFTVNGRTFRGTPHQPKNYFNKVELIAYGLKPNQFDLLIHQKTRYSLEGFIRSLCTRYSIYFNKKYHHTGGVFEGPYKSLKVENGANLVETSRQLHLKKNYSSYPEYLKSRVTLWVKPDVVLSFFEKAKSTLFKDVRNYKDFVERYRSEPENPNLEKSDLTSKADPTPNLILKPNPRIPEFMTISVVFLLLTTLGVRNIQAYTHNQDIIPYSKQAVSSLMSKKTFSPPNIETENNTAVLSSQTENVIEATPEVRLVKPVTIVSIHITDDSLIVNIRQKPMVNSQKIAEAKEGDVFESVSNSPGWYEIRLAEDGTTGFISEKYIETEEIR